MRKKGTSYLCKKSIVVIGVGAILLLSGCSSKEVVLDDHKTISQAELDFNTKLQEKTVRDPMMEFIPTKSEQSRAFKRDMSNTFSDISKYKKEISKRERYERNKKLKIKKAKETKLSNAKIKKQQKYEARKKANEKKVISTYYN